MKIRTSATHYVNYSDAEQAIKEHFGKTFEIVAMEEMGNNSSLTFSVDGEISPDAQKAFNAWLYGDNDALMFQTSVLFNYMVSFGVIPKGDYVIEICW